MYLIFSIIIYVVCMIMLAWFYYNYTNICDYMQTSFYLIPYYIVWQANYSIYLRFTHNYWRVCTFSMLWRVCTFPMLTKSQNTFIFLLNAYPKNEVLEQYFILKYEYAIGYLRAMHLIVCTRHYSARTWQFILTPDYRQSFFN